MANLLFTYPGRLDAEGWGKDCFAPEEGVARVVAAICWPRRCYPFGRKPPRRKLEIAYGRCYKTKAPIGWPVAETCSAKGCKINVPAGLAAEHLCILHFTLFVEQECAEMRRETALANTPHQRIQEFFQKISGRGETMVQVATSGYPMTDEIKARILSTLLTLMNCRESIERAAMRQSALRRFIG